MKKQTEIKQGKQGGEKEKTIEVRQSFVWHYAYWYFESFRALGMLAADAEFQKIYHALMECIGKHIDPPYEGDILDTFVVVEVEEK